MHAFATGRGAPPRYLATGEVEGTLLNQFAMDEHDGRLRVATTTEPVWGPVGGPADGTVDAVPQSAENWGRTPARTPARAVRRESFVTVLEQSGDRLVRVGRVGGLGPEESIRSVRFLGPVGYVVTFRQTDPLYVVDLSDPKAPRVAGELKIPGYSAYLHPVGPGLVLGVGRDGTRSGQILGLQMSLFDVSDPARPRRVSQVALPGSWSDAEGDHHAFTYAGGTAFVPFARESFARGRTTVDAGVVAVRLRGRSLSEPLVLRARGDGPVVVGPDGFTWPEVALRTFADERHVVTVTTRGIAVHDAVGLGRVGFAAF